MTPKEKLTYFAYANAHDPRSLRIGSLAFDFTGLQFQTPYIHYEDIDLESTPRLAMVEQRPSCFLSHKNGRDVEFGDDLKSLQDPVASPEGHVVVGKNASKVELKDPNSFLQQLLADPEDPISHWLRIRLSVARAIKTRHQNLMFTPDIRILTGILSIEDAVTYSLQPITDSGKSKPTDMAALLGAPAGAKFQLGQGCEAEAGSQIPGKKVWAAQWKRLHVKFITDPESAVDQSIKLRLMDLDSVENGKDEEEIFAQMSVGDVPEKSPVDGAEEKYDEEMWKSFDQDVGDLLEDLEDPY
ncbi:hypothetical protein F5X68DRAFT_233966 [Plectosphaerella plurivora]|uniref:Uncharacterized protein n=1 Tax=Plectosphaerella plurivora TaxID=936078 RepID=A0A9P8V7A3_9PEZI|nr:hypothetical protein F5X68DRAFT_233966 [Plectosphaerella plurivora]